ncbi:hypothetical protein FisN_18Hh243, partial [Fistulifera solaris]
MIQFLFVLALELTSKQFTTLRNFRPIIAPNVFRSAALDQLSQTEAQILYESLRSGIVLDLRNQDEMEKSQSKATEGSQWFYDQLQDSNRLTRIHLPILQNVDEFWDVTISHMPLWDRFAATAQTIVQAGALDRAAARYLESQGLFGLYRS